MASVSLTACSTALPPRPPAAGKGCRTFLSSTIGFGGVPSVASDRGRLQVVHMAPDDDRSARRNPLEFPVEWTKPMPASRPDIFHQFKPMRNPMIPTPLPFDPPLEYEEEEEGLNEEGEENPDQDEDWGPGTSCSFIQ